MKKVIVLIALASLVSVSVGCRNCNWFRRGALFAPAQPAAVEVPCEVYEMPMDECSACGPVNAMPPSGSTYSLIPGPTG